MTIHLGDCVTVMRTMPADSVDAVVTDPPYGLEFMGREWDSFKATGSSTLLHSPKDEGRTFTNESGHMWDNTKALPRLRAGHPFQAWCEAWGREALRVTRPGGYLLAFGGTRTHHRLVCGLEDAGWIIRDELTWIYACLSDDTEILTRRGWLSYNEVSTNDDALAFDPPSGSLQWEPIEAVHQYHHEGDMVRLVGDGTDQLVTLNHRLVLVDGPGVDQVPGVRDDVLAALRPPSEVEGPSVFEPLQRHTTLARSAVQDREAVGVAARERGVSAPEDDRIAQPSLEGRRYHLSEARELLGRAVRSRAGVEPVA